MPAIQILAESAVRSLALAAAVALLVRVVRLDHARFLKRLWTGVLVASMLMPVLVVLRIPTLAIPARWSTPRTIIAAPITPIAAPAQSFRIPTSTRVRLASDARRRAVAAPSHAIELWQIGALAYLAITVILLSRVLFGLLMAARLWRTAQPFATEETAAPVRLSLRIHSPATLGGGILLPLEALAWDEASLTAALAHESEHVREGDFYLQLAATLHLCVFWISPLAWWLRNHLAQLGEALCDRAAVLRSGDGLRYAELLLRMSSAGRAPAGMVAMAHTSGLSARIERLLEDPQFSSLRTLRRSRAAVVAGACAICALASTGTVRILAPQMLVLAAPQAPAAPPVPSPASPTSKPSAAVPADGEASADAAVAEAEKRADDADAMSDKLEASMAEDAVSDSGHDFTICEPEESACSFHGRAVSVPGTHPAGVLLFERDGKTYIVDDAATVKRAREAFAPMSALAKQQGELAARQGSFGFDQGQLGALTAKLAAEQANIAAAAAQFETQLHIELPKDFSKDVQAMTDAQVKLALEHDTLSADQLAALRKHADEARAHFDEEMKQFHIDQKKWNEQWSSHMREQAEQMRKQMEPLEKQIREQAAKQAALGVKQAELGSRQAELGRQMREESRKAEQAVRSLLDDAVKNGTAKPLP